MNYRIARNVALYHVPKDLVLNFDQMGLSLFYTDGTTRVLRGTKQVSVHFSDEKRNITCVPIYTAAGDMLPIQLIFLRTTISSHPCKKEEGLIYDHSKTHWSTLEIMQRLFINIIEQ